MKFARKVAVTIAASALTVGLAGVASPAQAADSSWGCGGWCLMAPSASR